MSLILAIDEPKGGTGKTTTVIHLARCLQLQGYRVRLYDSDYKQQSLYKWYLYSGGSESSPYPPVQVIDKRKDYLEIKATADEADISIIDGTSKLEETTVYNVLNCDAIIMPVQHSVADIDGSEKIIDLISQRRDATNGKQPAAYFTISRNIKGTVLSKGVKAAIDKTGIPLFNARISNSVLYMGVLGEGRTVFEMVGASAREKQAEVIKFTDEFKEYFSYAIQPR
jgi:chromosome partitioning protein